MPDVRIAGGTGDTQKVYNAINELIEQFNLLLAKLDDDAGVTDTDYEAELALDDPLVVRY